MPRDRSGGITGPDVHCAVEEIAEPWIRDGRARLVVDDETHGDRQLLLQPVASPGALAVGLVLRAWGADLFFEEGNGVATSVDFTVSDAAELESLRQIVRAALRGEAQPRWGRLPRYRWPRTLIWPEGRWGFSQGCLLAFVPRHIVRSYEPYCDP
ncbi:hypothetical protein [Sporichthya sp.]|uniref:hypothetical protein n=1 Tax=Sporichthya sp. TaxID=65475 RepID=UPI0017F66983|nr:hypothetical protein [Sporichthya sp.]MBA3742376.1 hypothetical protein [Sporichthya sp.]